jgi:aspartate ammonia-lyase
MPRLEHDLLGPRDVPDEAGHGIHALRAPEFPLLGRPMQQGLSRACGAARVAVAKEPR